MSARDWNPRRVFTIALLLTLAFRLWLAAVFPVTGDEAYFIWWGKVPDWGFYDHPPMIGWWLALLLKVSAAEWWLRLPIVLQPMLLALAVAAFLERKGNAIAWGAATLVLLAPANIWNIFITTDTPLIYFSVLSGLAWLTARRREDEGQSPWTCYLFAGLGLGGAVLSKYFAVLLGFAYLVDTLLRPGRRKFGGLLLVYALTLPGIALMAWWNAGHCWTNVMFNFYNRHREGNTGLSWQTPLLYAAMMLYLLTPALFWHLGKQGREALRISANGEGRALLVLGLVPLVLFGGLSLVKTIGLHWVLSFVPFVLMWLACMAGGRRLRSAVRFFAAFAAVHMLVVIIGVSLPLETWKKHRIYDGMVLTFDSKAVLAQMEPYKDYVWMMDGYSNAVTLGYNTLNPSTIAQSRLGERYIGVFGLASSHARHDDILTDVRALDGRDIAILRKTPAQPGDYQPYFDSVEERSFEVRGVTFHVILGHGFNYAAYRDGILTRIKQDFYRIPPALPQTACYFCDRYFPGEACRR